MEKAGEVLFSSRSDVNSVLTDRDCLERCIKTFKWVGIRNKGTELPFEQSA